MLRTTTKEIKRKFIYMLIFVFLPVVSSVANPKIEIEPGIYVLVSFSLNDQSLRNYFIESQRYGAKLVMRGLAGDPQGRNRFAETKVKIEKARINVDINPNLFEQFNIQQVPTIVVVDTDKTIKKVSGHITLQKALEIINVPCKTQEVKR